MANNGHKSAFVSDLETVKNALRDDVLVGTVNYLGDVQGPVPFGTEEHGTERTAQLELPAWLVQGNARGPVAQAYWQGVTARPNAANRGMAGPRGADLFAGQMQRLWANPRLRAAALDAMRPEDRLQLAQLISGGQHPGYARGMHDGREVRLEEPGTARAHRVTAQQQPPSRKQPPRPKGVDPSLAEREAASPRSTRKPRLFSAGGEHG